MLLNTVKAHRKLRVATTQHVFTLEANVVTALPDGQYEAAIAAGAIPVGQKEVHVSGEEQAEPVVVRLRSHLDDEVDVVESALSEEEQVDAVVHAIHEIVDSADASKLNKDGTPRFIEIKKRVEFATPALREKALEAMAAG